MNIWEIVNVNDLIKILKKNEKKFVIVAITLDSTPKSTVKILKKFLLHYSKIYHNLTFLYYKADLKDLNKLNLLNKNTDEYPFVYHIYDTTEIFVTINRANEQTIYEAFNAVEKHYKKDLHDNTMNQDKQSESNIKINENINDVSAEKIKNDEITAQMNRKVLQHQKLLKKISVLEKHKTQFNDDFLEDIRKRKQEEQKR